MSQPLDIYIAIDIHKGSHPEPHIYKISGVSHGFDIIRENNPFAGRWIPLNYKNVYVENYLQNFV